MELVRQTNVLDWYGFCEGWGLTRIIGWTRRGRQSKSNAKATAEADSSASLRNGNKKERHVLGSVEFFPFVVAAPFSGNWKRLLRAYASARL